MLSIRVNPEAAIKRLVKVASSIVHAESNALAQAGQFMTTEVKQSIAGRRDETRSVDTGRFLNSVSMEKMKKAVKVSTNVRYAPHLEYGTSRIKPRAHFQNSLNRNKKNINEIFIKKVKEAVRL